MFNFEKTDPRITRYKYERADGVYFLDVIETAGGFELWITGEDRGISTLCFGSPKVHNYEDGPRGVTHADFMELVRWNVDHYATYYKKDVDIYEEAMCEYIENGGDY